MSSDPRLCENCGMGKLGCELVAGVRDGLARIGVAQGPCCSNCKHPEPRESKRSDVAPRVERKELVN